MSRLGGGNSDPATNGRENMPPKDCPFCGETVPLLPNHLPKCDAVPDATPSDRGDA